MEIADRVTTMNMHPVCTWDSYLMPFASSNPQQTIAIQEHFEFDNPEDNGLLDRCF